MKGLDTFARKGTTGLHRMTAFVVMMCGVLVFMAKAFGTPYTTLEAISVLEKLSVVPATGKDKDVWRSNMVGHLHESYHVPRLFLESMSTSMLQRLARLCKERLIAHPRRTPKFLFAHPQNGLANRVRVVASAMAHAKDYGDRIVVVFWEKDRHMEAGLFDLFQDRNDLVVVSKLVDQWPFGTSRLGVDSAQWANIDTYNYMVAEEGAEKGREVIHDLSRSIYFRGCELLVTNDEKKMRRTSSKMLKQLKPVPEVLGLIRKFEARHGKLVNRIGVHIRTMSVRDEFKDFDPEREYGLESMERMEYWRSKSSLETFATEMRAQLEADPKATFFVSTDTPHVIGRLKEMFPGKVETMPLDQEQMCERKRDAACLRLALADLLSLSRTKLFLGSNFSSFTSMVLKYGVKAWRRVGIEFATE
eukprot:CAMPEP_0198327646 /NCGR_PEP_ID=MMETSP1450-20131203/14863_1 /TAXON_ID=753684 ORGANISM="Madagascaria erythrocladiodes, Strain CCMP3234" /NCGR_SAMPLE_ID=MMETSP1450 /ASSEMBLY_ACC=CAM_ASM_001115 /LENGTH=417 /DNA_ID=CAMNT_0044031703 /DNA_START=237 /DNA_END=1490 /DNA_ORIENTATION=-